MIISGQFPYSIEGPAPFITPSSVGATAIGFSGILFEECQFLALAEWRRYSWAASGYQDSFSFRHYQHSSGVPTIRFGDNAYPDVIFTYSGDTAFSFEPKSDGSTLANSGQIHTTNWIRDLRLALSGLLDLDTTISTWGVTGKDCDLPLDMGQQFEIPYSQIWLGALANRVGRSESNLNHFEIPEKRHYTHAIWSGQQIPYGQPEGYLGASGALYDIDLREIQYHPIPRFAKLSINRLQSITNPIFPCFAHPNGLLIKTNSLEDTFVADGNIGNEFDYRHVQSGVVRIDGDMLLSSTNIYFGESIVQPSALSIRKFYNGPIDFDEEDTGDFYVENNAANATPYPVNRAFCGFPLGSDGDVVPIRVANFSCPVPSSLEVSFFPPSGTFAPFGGNDSSQSRLTYNMYIQLPCSGFSYYSDALWVGHDFYVVNSSDSERYGGIALVPPVGALAFPWVRLDPVEQTSLSELLAERNSIGECLFASRVGNQIWHTHLPVFPLFPGFRTGRVFKRDLLLEDVPTRIEVPETEVDNSSGGGTTLVTTPNLGVIYNSELWDAQDRDIGGWVIYNRPIDGSTDIFPVAIEDSTLSILGFFEVTPGFGIGLGIKIQDDVLNEFLGHAGIIEFITNTDPFDPITEIASYSPPTIDCTDNTGHGFTKIRIDRAINITGATSFNNGLWCMGGIGRAAFAEFNFLGRITFTFDDETTVITIEEVHPITFTDLAFNSNILARIGLLET